MQPSGAASHGSTSGIKRVVADGNHVIVHVHAIREPGTRGNAIIDIFKLENGKIVEHWDSPIPAGREHERHVLTSAEPSSARFFDMACPAA